MKVKGRLIFGDITCIPLFTLSNLSSFRNVVRKNKTSELVSQKRILKYGNEVAKIYGLNMFRRGLWK